VRFASLIRRVAWRYGFDGDDLDEVMQDVRVRLWRARGQSEQIGGSTASYVYRTAISAALDLIRRKRRVGSREEGIGETSDEGERGTETLSTAFAGGTTPDAQLEASELRAAIASAVDSIPASRRPVVRMYLMGHPPLEIATLMGWTEPKTRNLLYRGLADLRSALTAAGIGPGGQET
jgi:RNA polymerase sigma-70 factor (ECF subfamily)